MVKVFLQQGIVRLGHQFDQLTVEGVDPVAPIRRQFAGIIFTGAVGFIGMQLLAQNIGHLVEIGAGIDRPAQGKHPGSKALPGQGQYIVEFGIFTIKHIDGQQPGEAVVGGGLPNLLGAYLNPSDPADQHQREIGHAQGALYLTEEVGVARCVEQIYFLFLPGKIQDGGIDGNLPLDLIVMVIGDRAAALNGADTVDFSSIEQHGIRQDGLDDGTMPGQGAGKNVLRVKFGHYRFLQLVLSWLNT